MGRAQDIRPVACLFLWKRNRLQRKVRHSHRLFSSRFQRSWSLTRDWIVRLAGPRKSYDSPRRGRAPLTAFRESGVFSWFGVAGSGVRFSAPNRKISIGTHTLNVARPFSIQRKILGFSRPMNPSTFFLRPLRGQEIYPSRWSGHTEEISWKKVSGTLGLRGKIASIKVRIGKALKATC